VNCRRIEGLYHGALTGRQAPQGIRLSIVIEREGRGPAEPVG